MQIALLVLLICITPSVAHACSCEIPREPRRVTITRAFERADAVFSGKVVRLGPELKEGQHAVVFTVDRVWKGDSVTRRTIYTGRSGGECGFDFVPGQRYMVFAHHSPYYGGLATGLCGQTTATKAAGEIIAVLGAGTPVEHEPPWWRRRGLLFGGALLVVGATLVLTAN